jgi:hypothetical protein
VLNLIDGWRSIPWLDSLLSQVHTESRGRVCFVAGNCHLVMKQAMTRARSAPGWLAENPMRESKDVEDLIASIANLGITGLSLWNPIGAKVLNQISDCRITGIHGTAEQHPRSSIRRDHGRTASRFTVPGCSPRRIATATARSSRPGTSRPARSATVQASGCIEI